MAYNYLNKDGVAYLWEKIKGKFVQKETGKGLSTNDYTTAEKTKLAGIATGAQVNVLEGIQVAGGTITPTNKIANVPAIQGATASAAGKAGVAPAPATGQQNYYLAGDGTWHSTATTAQMGLMSADDKSKLNNIAAGAEVNQNAFSTVKVGTVTVTAETTTDTLNLAGSGSISITADANTDTITISGINTTYSTATTAANGLMSSADKTKLNGIASGAQVNQNAFTTIKVGTTDLVADSKTDTLTITAGNNITLTPTTSSDSFTIAATDTKYTSGTGITVDGTTINHSNSITAGTIGSSSASSGATLAIPYASYDGQGHITGKGTHTHTISGLAASVISSGTLSTAVLPTIPVDKGGTGATTPAGARTNLGAAPLASPIFTGTPGAPTAAAGTASTQIATTAFVSTAITNALADITGISYEVVQSLPATGQAGVIYLLANSGTAPNIYDEYIWTGTAFEKIGTTDVDLSGYVQKTDMVAITNAEIDTICV